MSERERTVPIDATALKARSRLLAKGHRYEDFVPGTVFRHHWGRTFTAGENALFTSLTLHFNPLYFNDDHARALGHPGSVVNPFLVLNTAIGLSVEDLSEGNGPFLGIDEVAFGVPVRAGDTMLAESVVLERRPSSKHQHFGIVRWRTSAVNGSGGIMVTFVRSNLVRYRE